MKKLIIMLTALLVMAGCSFQSGSFGLFTNETSAYVEAKNADTDSRAETTLDITDAEQLHMSAQLEEGAIRISLYDEEDTSVEPAAFIIMEDGTEYTAAFPTGHYTMVATVEEKATGRVDIVLEERTMDDTQNPIMNFVGTYAAGRCAIDVSAGADNIANFEIMWGSSAAETSQWRMTGEFDSETMTVTYNDASRTDLVFAEDGSVKESNVVYENGSGSFVFNEDGTLIWNDDVENAAEDIVFNYAN